jgi:hypothetical protein
VSFRWVQTGASAAAFALGIGMLAAQPNMAKEPRLARERLASENFGNDAPWFLRNIPFLEIDDAEIQQIYYYRWKLYRSHIREIGEQGTTVLEFLDNVPWSRQPYSDLNDSASFHLMEGRWLRDPAIVDNLIDHLYSGGGNDRHFSEPIAAATESSTLVTGNVASAMRHLDTMEYTYNEWDDHFDQGRGLYWIEPLLDATEYTISSIDASGAGFTDKPSADQNHNGFTGGFAFRPSINSYQYANAMAIARIAALAGQHELSEVYTRRAERIRAAVLAQLWNEPMQHFTDRYQRSTRTVTAGEFIRGRELVGYVPWLYELPQKEKGLSEEYASAWRHLLSPEELGGAYGLRTVEPSYPRYLTQYRYDRATGSPECQWNGPSWPFQTSQALTALANLLDDYPQSVMTKADYLRLLRQYTHQHFLSAGHPDIQEDYNPDTGKPIVGLERSHHYNHSTYIDLILSGLIGVRPRADNTLEIDPLLPNMYGQGDHPIRYFALQHLAYHGHDVSIVYDADGGRYGIGAGLSVFADSHRVYGPHPLAPAKIVLQPAAPNRIRSAARRVDLSVNPGVPEGPRATASSSVTTSAIDQAIDGRLWFFPENPNGWSSAMTDLEPTSWYSIDLRRSRRIGSIELYFFSDGKRYQVPAEFQLQYRTGAGWQEVPGQQRMPQQPLANGENKITFPAIMAQELRVIVANPKRPATFRLIEMKTFAP